MEIMYDTCRSVLQRCIPFLKETLVKKAEAGGIGCGFGEYC